MLWDLHNLGILAVSLVVALLVIGPSFFVKKATDFISFLVGVGSRLSSF